MPLHPELQTWAEGQMQAEHKPDFEHALQCFLWAYSAEGYGLPKVRHFTLRMHSQ